MSSEEDIARIRALNDAFRNALLGGRLVVTAAVSELPEEILAAVIERMRNFSEFTEDNDPHGEHDFGSFTLGGDTFFWKIDYYDKDVQYGSEDPSDPSVTTRVLTLMFASDY